MKKYSIATIVFLGAVTTTPGLVFCQNGDAFYRVAPKAPEELHALFRYDGNPMPLVSAHRGGAVPDYPENCIATFENTLRYAFSILEIDLRYTRDGHLVLHHDATLERTTTGTGRVADRTLQELKALRLKDTNGDVTVQRIPTLGEVLEWARGKTVVILDRKDVSVKACVEKIEEHQAEAYAMVMAYSYQDIEKCHELNQEVMMEVMIGDRNRFRGFEATGVPWSRVVAFVGHTSPEDKGLLAMLHAKGVCCMAGTSRNLDRRLRVVASHSDRAALAQEYRARLDFGVDLIETDLPVQLGELLYAQPVIPESKSQCFHLP